MIDFIAKRPGLLTLAGALLLSLSFLGQPVPAHAADLEKCYGISKAGQDDGSKEMDVPGMSSTDFQGGAYKYVTKGTCEEISTPFGPGSLEPLDNRPPKS